MIIIRSASEAEVIAEFLRSEYHQKEYHIDRAIHESLVFSADLENAGQNQLRKKLLFRRHRVTWNELPPDVNWLLVQLNPDDISKLRVFPRGHWPKLAAGSDLTVAGVTESIRKRKFSPDTHDDISAIHALAYQMRQKVDVSSIILIGLDLEHPITVLEGNHRVLAAALVGPDRVCQFRTYLGLSTKMHDCYWYRSESSVFLRHAWRRMRDLQPRRATAVKNPSLPGFSE